MKKLFSLLIGILFVQQSFACAGDGYYYSYSLFTQELILSPRYTPFLLEYNAAYYSPVYLKADRNENVEEWQNYLGIGYEDAYYLVMKAPATDIQSLIKGNKIANDTLSFATPAFVKKNIQALKYISYSKYLEPYMIIQPSDNPDAWWRTVPEKSVTNLNYNKVTDVLIKSWNAETDKELKLRYGYQLVRFAHYNRKYETAIEYFTKYVENLNYKPVMYYYALNQKAGAERGLGNVAQANYEFIKVFTHTKNLQENVYNSIRLSSDYDLRELLSMAKSKEEQNDIYLLLGFQNFNNPLSTIEDIIKNTPDAVQAKVLMARAVKEISDAYIIEYYPDNGQKDKRIPFLATSNSRYNYYDEETLNKIPSYLQQAKALAKRMAESKQVKDQDYWNITLTYLYFLERNYSQAKSCLNKVKSQEQIYVNQKAKLNLLIEISEQPSITPEFETHLYSTYKELFSTQKYPTDMEDPDYANSTYGFIIDILSNRYFIQGDYAKSYLLENKVDQILNTDFQLMDEVEKFYHKKNKNNFEQFVYTNSLPSKYSEQAEKYLPVNKFNFDSYIAQVRGIKYFQQGDLPKALDYFTQAQKDSKDNQQNFTYIYNTTSDTYFGYNKIECFNCKEPQVVGVDYLKDFPFIKKEMNFKETTEILLALQKESTGNTEKASKANYLLGNYFYNTSTLGYFRGSLLNYTVADKHPYLEGKVYLKYNYEFDVRRFNPYDTSYPYDDFNFPEKYFVQALKLAKDNELKARILFALSKTEQGIHYQNLKKDYSYGYLGDEDILIQGRKYFKELAAYKNTSFYKEVKTNCKYFDHYITHFAEK